MNFKKALGGAGLALIVAGAIASHAHADMGRPGFGPGPGPGDHGAPPMDLDHRMDMLEHEMQDLRGQVAYLQQRVNALAVPPPPVAPAVYACTVTDTLGSVFMGKGPTQLEATYAAQQACGQKYGGQTQFCTGSPQCQAE